MIRLDIVGSELEQDDRTVEMISSQSNTYRSLLESVIQRIQSALDGAKAKFLKHQESQRKSAQKNDELVNQVCPFDDHRKTHYCS